MSPFDRVTLRVGSGGRHRLRAGRRVASIRPAAVRGASCYRLALGERHVRMEVEVLLRLSASCVEHAGALPEQLERFQLDGISFTFTDDLDEA